MMGGNKSVYICTNFQENVDSARAKNIPNHEMQEIHRGMNLLSWVGGRVKGQKLLLEKVVANSDLFQPSKTIRPRYDSHLLTPQTPF